MKIKFLGTAAAEGWPALFCNCEGCIKARELGGRDIRTRSQAIIDDVLLIDFPCDTYMHALNTGIDMSAVKISLITHAHSDHFYPEDYFIRGDCYAHEMTSQKLILAAGKTVIDTFHSRLEGKIDASVLSDIEIVELHAFEPVPLEGYKITPLPADHMYGSIAFVYLIEKGGKAILYLNDTGMPLNEVFDYLKSTGVYVDFVSFDCTYCLLENSRGHMGIKCNYEAKLRLIDMGICDDKTRFYINHFSHNGKVTHKDLSFAALEYGFNVTFDGCEVDLSDNIYVYETHAHTSEVSPCGKVCAKDVIRSHYNAGLKGIAITDHYYKGYFDKLGDIPWREKAERFLSGYRKAREAAQGLDFDVILGMELRFEENFNDYLIYGVTEELIYDYPELYKMNPESFKEFAGKHNLTIYQAHPFRKGLTRAPAHTLTGVEVENGNPRHNSKNDRAKEFAEENNLRQMTGTDYHQPQDLGYSPMRFDRRIRNSGELRDILP